MIKLLLAMLTVLSFTQIAAATTAADGRDPQLTVKDDFYSNVKLCPRLQAQKLAMKGLLVSEYEHALKGGIVAKSRNKGTPVQ